MLKVLLTHTPAGQASVLRRAQPERLCKPIAQVRAASKATTRWTQPA